jgi:methylated-DNA-protein-cysteine methyltransferase related protein
MTFIFGEQMSKKAAATFYEQVYAVVRRIPVGKVTSYGRIAQMLGAANAARAVGYALHALKDDDGRHRDVPWQRVINSQGRITIVNRDHVADEQAALLRAEGVEVSDQLRVDMNRYLWQGLHWVEIDDILSGKSQVAGSE